MDSARPATSGSPAAFRRRWTVAGWLAWIALLVIALAQFPAPQRMLIWDAIWDAGHLVFGAGVAWGVARVVGMIYPTASIGLAATVALVATTLVGGAVEILQAFSPQRHASWGDLFRDLLGALAAVAILASWRAGTARWPHRALAAAAAVAILAGIVPVVRCALDYRQRAAAFPVLFSADHPALRRFAECQSGEMTVERPPAGWPSGQQRPVARVVLYPGKWPSLSLAETHADWRGYRLLKMDLYLDAPTPRQLELRIHDRPHDSRRYDDRFNRPIRIEPGFQTWTIPLEEIRRAPKDRLMRLDRMASVMVFAPKLQEPLEFWTDNWRLE